MRRDMMWLNCVLLLLLKNTTAFMFCDKPPVAQNGKGNSKPAHTDGTSAAFSGTLGSAGKGIRVASVAAKEHYRGIYGVASRPKRGSCGNFNMIQTLPLFGTKENVVASRAAVDLQEELRLLCSGTSNAVAADGDRQSKIEELAQELNALNPIKAPARSPLLAGKWRLLYSTVPGPSSGRIGPFVANVFQDIHPEEKKIVNILELGPSWALRGALEADVEILDSRNWAITFDVVYKSFAGFRVQEKKFDRAVTERRIWEMTYLDQDFRVLYGRQESMAKSEGFIFVMERDN